MSDQIDARISRVAREFVIAQPQAGRFLLIDALRKLRESPLSGDPLPYPWRPGLLGLVVEQYFITYRFQDNFLDVLSITVMPAIEDLTSL